MYNLTEAMVNDFGYNKLGNKKYNEAIAAFKYNVSNNPGSANTYDSLGEAYERAGMFSEAIECLNKAIELAQKAKDPNLGIYKTSLERINNSKNKK